MRTALVGLGWWGRELAAAAERTDRGVVIVAGCSPVEAERARFSARFACPSYASLDEILADPAIEGVILATPHSQHAEQVIASARAGKHVLVEKPLALTTADAMAAVAACAEHGVTLAVGHNRRLLPQVDMLRDLLAEGASGHPLHVEANFSTAEALSFPTGHWRTSRRECPGGAMTVLGIHVIDWLHALFGPVERVSAHFARRAVTTDMDDCAFATLTFRSGLTASLVTLYSAPYRNAFIVHGSEATISVIATEPESRSSRPTLTVRRREGPMSAHVMPYVDTLALQFELWAAASAGRGRPAVDGIEAARNSAVLDAIVHSAAAGAAPVGVDYAGLLRD